MADPTNPRYFVTVFGDPEKRGDAVESGTYTAGENYPSFTVQPGDVMLLYCTEEYMVYSLAFAGIGIVLDVIREVPETIRYRWIPFSQPILRSEMNQAFDAEDLAKMAGSNLRFSTRRVFDISKRSFDALVGQRLTAWNRL
jgi:hypothetical protein